MSYNISTQYRKWQTSLDNINKLRKMAMKRVPNNDNIYTITTTTPPPLPTTTTTATTSTNPPLPTTTTTTTTTSEDDILNIWYNEEDIIILKQFCNIILNNFNSNTIISDIKFYWRITSKTIIYFKRFYLNNNILSYDPRIIMLTCIFLAGKVEECRLNLKSLIELVNIGNESDILSHELILIEALDFDLKIHHPHSLMKTLVSDISLSLEDMMKSNIINNNDYNHIIQSDNRKQWAINAEDILNKLYLSYALLCYNPMALVICALKNTEPVVIIDRYLEYRHGATVSAELQQEAAKVDAFLNTANVEEDPKTIKKYMKRLQTSAIWSS